MSNDDLSLEVNDYTINEIIDIFKLNKQYNHKDLDDAYQKKIKTVNKLQISNDNKHVYKEFFTKCFYYLERILKKNTYGSNFVLENNVKNDVPKIQIQQDRYQVLQQPNLIQHDSTVVVQPNVQEQIEVFNNPVPTGILNKIRRRTVKHIFSIDTEFRNDPNINNPSDFTYYLPMSINNVISMKLCAAEIPNTWYHIDNYTNIFYIKVTTNTVDPTGTNAQFGNFKDGVEFKITIPIGNWAASTLSSKIRLYFDKTPGLRWLYFGINNQDGKCYIRYKTNDEITILNDTYGFTNTLSELSTAPNDYVYEIMVKDTDTIDSKQPIYFQDSILYTLGFNRNYYKVDSDNVYDIDNTIIYNTTQYNEWDNTYSGMLKTERIFGQNKISYLFISINDYAGNSKDTIISGYEREHYLSKDILARIQVKFGSFSSIMDNNGDNIYKQRDYFGPVKIERLHIKIMDKYGRHINLNDSNYSLAFEFEQLYS